MKFSYKKILFVFLVIGIVSYSLHNFFNRIESKSREISSYRPIDFDSVLLTISWVNHRKEITIVDKKFIDSFWVKALECTTVGEEKTYSDKIYSFKFYGQTKALIDVLYLTDGRIILSDVTPNRTFIGSRYQCTDSLRDFLNKIDESKMQKLY